MNKPVKTIFALIFIIILNIGSLGFAHATSADGLVNLTNQDRAENGVGSLSVNNKLTAAAFAKANDMLLNDYFAHISSSGKTPWDFIKQAGYNYTEAGENLAIGYDSDQELEDAWMNSSSHRANILNKNFREIGIAVVVGEYQGKETTVVVQMFGTPVLTTTEADAQIEATQDQTQDNVAPEETVAPANTEPSPTPTPVAPLAIVKEKTSFQPATIFSGEKVKFQVTLTGAAQEISLSLADQKINLLESGTIQQDGDSKTYSIETAIEKVGQWPVTLTVLGANNQTATQSLGTLSVAEKTLVKNTTQNTGSWQKTKDFINRYANVLAMSLLILFLGFAGVLIWRLQKRPHLA